VIYVITVSLALIASESTLSSEPIDTLGKIIVGETTEQLQARFGLPSYKKSWKIGKNSKLLFEGIHSPECTKLKDGETLELWAYPIEGGYKQIVFMSGRVTVMCSRWGNFESPLGDLNYDP
jgi:hypothetical protein